LTTNKEITSKIFESRDEFTFEDYIELRSMIKDALLHYDFHQYDVFEENGQEYISGEDFARSLLIFLPYSKFNQYIKHI
jgi:hypothetical protein